MNRDSCPNFEKLSAHVDHELSASELDAISNHITECTYCRRSHEHIVQLREDLAVLQNDSLHIDIVTVIQQQLETLPEQRPVRRRLNYGLLSYGLAASFALVVGINLGNQFPVDEVKVDLTFVQAAQMAPFSFIPPGSINLDHATCFIGKRI